MSTLELPPVLRHAARARPGLWPVARGTFYGQAVCAIALWAACAVLGLAGLLGVRGRVAIFAPWQLEGVWSVLATVGWAGLVSALVGYGVRFGVAARTGVSPSHVWCMLAVAAGGYGSLALAPSAAVAAVAALACTPALVWVAAFSARGEARPSPVPRWLAGVRHRAGLALALALVLAAPYSVLHPFVGDATATPVGADSATYAQDPDGQPAVYRVAPGQSVRVAAGIHGGLLSATVTGAQPLIGGAALRVWDVSLATGAPPWPPAHVPRPPVALRAHQMLWIRYTVAVTRCAAAQVPIERVRISYRIWGIALSQTVRLQTPVLLVCR